jgi:signal peptidase I
MWFLLIVPLSLIIGALCFQAFLGYAASAPMGGNEMAEKPQITLNVSHNSESMYPTFTSFDKIFGEEFNASKDKLREGDIVMYRASAGNLLIHRIVYMNGTFILTKGDNNMIADVPIDQSQVVSKITGVIYR